MWKLARTCLALCCFLLSCGGPAFSAAPGFDASGASKGNFSGTNSGSFNASTTSGNVLLLLGIVAERVNSAGASASVSTVAGGSLGWAPRSQLQSAWAGSCVAGAGNPCYGDTELWWACSSSALSTTSITVTFGTSIDNAVMILVPVTGVCPSAAPFDTNVGLPGKASNLTNSTTTVGATVSTTQASDLIFEVVGFSNDVGFSDQTSGTCRAWSKTTTVGTGDTSIAFSAQQFASVQTSLTFNFANTGPCTDTHLQEGWSAIADAVTNAAAASGPPVGSLLTLGVGR